MIRLSLPRTSPILDDTSYEHVVITLTVSFQLHCIQTSNPYVLRSIHMGLMFDIHNQCRDEQDQNQPKPTCHTIV